MTIRVAPSEMDAGIESRMVESVLGEDGKEEEVGREDDDDDKDAQDETRPSLSPIRSDDKL